MNKRKIRTEGFEDGASDARKGIQKLVLCGWRKNLLDQLGGYKSYVEGWTSGQRAYNKYKTKGEG